MKRRTRVLALFLGIIAMVATLGACSSATNTDQCAWVVGDGQDGGDRNLHRVVYPGQAANEGVNEDVWFVPCSYRNFIVTPRTDVGDRHDAVLIRTKSPDGQTPGTPLKVWLSAYWTPNQDRAAMEDFLALCRKYTCYTQSADEAGSANYSTPGWNSMLRENFSFPIDRIGLVAGTEFDDSLWRNPSKEQTDKLANRMSELFAEEVRRTTGSNKDLFCGSGNSAWPDPTKPGEGEFKCTQVRFAIDRIEPDDPKLVEQTNQANVTDQRRQDAEKLYGPTWAPYWLGVQDACRDKPNCTIVVSPNGSLPVPVR